MKVVIQSMDVVRNSNVLRASTRHVVHTEAEQSTYAVVTLAFSTSLCHTHS